MRGNRDGRTALDREGAPDLQRGSRLLQPIGRSEDGGDVQVGVEKSGPVVIDLAREKLASQAELDGVREITLQARATHSWLNAND